LQRCVALLALCVGLASCATRAPVDLSADALAAAMRRAPNVLLGEVHDNAAQHRARAEALRTLLRGGARPALVFEQFDRERQADIDRARKADLPAGRARADHLIEAGAGVRSGWDWTLYRPFVELALDYDLPIVAANLSRADASRIAKEGFAGVFGAPTIAALGLARVPPDVVAAQEQAVDDGHCGQMPKEWLPRLARAQIARDAVMAQLLRPHLSRGAVLLAGDGHVRNDIGVPRYLSTEERAITLTIGLVESENAQGDWRAPYDIAFVTPTQTRADPCAELANRKR
jgi:uncharacterized iron-regulated protein